MKVVELRWTPYRIPFVAAVGTAHGAWSVREGAIVQLRTGDGAIGAGDVAPLPSHGTADIAACLALLDDIAPRILGTAIDDVPSRIDALVPDDAPFAPLRCALETALLDATARAAGVSVARLLTPDPARDVAVNALVDAAPCAAAAAAAARARAAGFRDIKLKVGMAASVAEETARVAAVRGAAGPAARLRLDANGAWTEEQAIARIRAMEPYAIDLVEQPIPPGDIFALRRVREAVPVPVAADEGAASLAAVRALIEARAVDAVVVKLPVVGGPRLAREMIALVTAAGVAPVVTSAFESGVGVAAALQLSATLPRPARACGLATLGLLADDLIAEQLRVDGGRMALPGAPGIGVTVDAPALARYAAGAERVVRA
ncbi:MAG: o-succinylbenzoate synthase [Chloroflexota bacterium]|nr:o-succinylbenzoate synthase [Chloroflexota bacterium]